MLGHSALGEYAIGEIPPLSLLQKAEHYLATALSKCQAGDPGWKDYVRDLADTVATLERVTGRPPLPKGQTRAEQQAAYVEKHGLQAAAEHFNVKEATVERNWRRVIEKQRGQ